MLKPIIVKPKLNSYGYSPYSSRYKDRITGDQINVLIDHLLSSQGLKIIDGTVGNPYLERGNEVIQKVSHSLKNASDHFPVLANIEF